MKRFLLLFLFVTWPLCARAAEPQLDHAFGPSVFSSQVLAFSPDAKKLAVAGSDGVKIYESATWKVLQTRAACRWRTSCVAWSSDGKSLAAGGLTFRSEPTGEIWLWSEGQTARHWTTASADVVSLAFSPDGKWLASASAGNLTHEPVGGEARLWDAANGAFKTTLGSYQADNAHVAFSPDGRSVVFSSENGSGGKEQTTLCSATSGRSLKQWHRPISPLAFDANNALITGAVPFALTKKNGLECRVDAIQGDDYLKLHFSARKHGFVTELAGHDLGNAVPCAVFGGDFLAVVTMKRLDSGFETAVEIWKLDGTPPQVKLYQILGNRTAAPRALAVSGDGRTLGIAIRSGTALLDISTLRLRRVVPDAAKLGASSHATLTLSHNAKRLFEGRWLDVSGTVPREVRPWREPGEASAFGLSADGLVLCGAFGGSYGVLREKGLPAFFSVPDRKFKGDRPIGVAQMVAWSPDNSRIAVIGSLNSERQLFVFGDQANFEGEIGNKASGGASLFQTYGAVAFSREGTRILTAGYGRTGTGKYGPRLDVWDAFTREHQSGLVLPTSGGKAFGGGQVSSAGFSPDGQILAVGGFLAENRVLAPRLLLFDTRKRTRIGSLPLPFRESGTNQSWVFLDSSRIAVLNGNAVEIWNWKHHRREKSVYLVPQGNGLKLAIRSF